MAASVGGVAFSLGVAAEACAGSASLQRRISATVVISSMEVCLDRQPFVQLLQRQGERSQTKEQPYRQVFY